jgi:pilus assembly protein CpaB
MSRRKRALSFLLLAMLAAGAAATIAERYGSTVMRGYGPLRPVVVLVADLAAGKRLGPEEVESAMAVRRIPVRFAPADALSSPAEVVGLVPKAALPAGSYLQATQLDLPRHDGGGSDGLRRGRRPVEISVSGAGALLAAGPVRAGSRVDVVVTAEPTGSGPGRTYVAAPAVQLLALRPVTEGTGPGSTAAATLGLTKRQALRLIAAESFARKVTLLPEG